MPVCPPRGESCPGCQAEAPRGAGLMLSHLWPRGLLTTELADCSHPQCGKCGRAVFKAPVLHGQSQRGSPGAPLNVLTLQLLESHLPCHSTLPNTLPGILTKYADTYFPLCLPSAQLKEASDFFFFNSPILRKKAISAKTTDNVN